MPAQKDEALKYSTDVGAFKPGWLQAAAHYDEGMGAAGSDLQALRDEAQKLAEKWEAEANKAPLTEEEKARRRLNARAAQREQAGIADQQLKVKHGSRQAYNALSTALEEPPSPATGGAAPADTILGGSEEPAPEAEAEAEADAPAAERVAEAS